MGKLLNEVSISYDDITLIPTYSELKSRSNANTEMHGYSIPIIASCMDTLGNPKMMELFITKKIPFIIHRAFKSAKEQYNHFIKEIYYIKDNIKYDYNCIWFAVGSVQKYKDWIDYLLTNGVRKFCVDMAHGDSKACIDTIKYIKEQFKIYNEHNSVLKQIPHIIAGNVASAEGFKHLETAGANGIRVGVASGQICFVPGTKVMYVSPSGKMYHKNIEQIQVGDKVLTASSKVRKVLNTFKNNYSGEIYIINDIKATPNHKFYIFDHEDNRHKFIPIKDINQNTQSFINVDGKTEKLNIDIDEYSGTVYNIEVDDEHTYTVGEKCLGVSNCSTALNTAMGVPILTSIQWANKIRKNKNTWIIADGGVKYTGDITKAIWAGADFCMIGKMLASTDLATGKCYNKKLEIIPDNEVIYPHQIKDIIEKIKKQHISNKEKLEKINELNNKIIEYKSYHGMASRAARSGLLSYAAVEGVDGLSKYISTTEQYLQDTYLRLQASLSYGGATNWYNFRKTVNAIRRSNAGIIAADTHLEITTDR